MYENSANTVTTVGSNNMTEWGIALLRSSATNGAQHNRILDNTISLDRTYPNTFGIYSNVRHSATAVGTTSDITNVSGSNFSNVFYTNRISNVNMGIAIIGSSTDARMDDSNDVGGSSSSTGNIITNWGGNSLPTATFAGNMSSEYYGILMRCQKNDNTSYNTITSSTSLSGSTAAIVRGIHKGTTTGTVTGSFSTNIDHNTVTITDNLPTGSSSMSRLDGIICTDKLADAVLSISDNTITGLAITGSASGRYMRAISNSSAAAEVYINRNIIKGNTTTASAAGGWFIAIDQTGTISNTIEIKYNLIGDNATTTPAISYAATANGATIVRGINNDPTSNPTGTASVSITGNTLYGFVQANSPTNSHTYINCDHTTTINSDIHIDGNHFVNIDAHVSGDVAFITSLGTMAASAGAQLSVSNNDIVGTFTKSLGGGHVYIYNANGSSSTGNIMNESGNNFSNITLSGSAIMHGWYNNEGASGAGPEKSILDNVFDSWTCNTSGSVKSTVIYCNWASGDSRISGNSISNITAYADLDGIQSASATAATLDINGNQIFDISSTNAAATALNISGRSADTYISNTSIDIGTSSGSSVTGINISSAGTANTVATYYNTVYLHSTVPIPLPVTYGTVCLSVTGNTTSNIDHSIIRNNILVNTSDWRGTNGRTTVINNNGVSSLANYDVKNNNNVLWVGSMTTPIYNSVASINDGHHYIYYDNGSNNKPLFSDPTIGFINYVQANVSSTTENLTLHMMPDLTQTTINGPPAIIKNVLNYSSINCPIFNHGNSENVPAGPFPTPDYRTDASYLGSTARLFVAPYITDIGADQVILTNKWNGNVSTAWTTDGNWDLGVSPSNYTGNAKGMSVYIPRVTNQPVVSTTTQVRNLMFQTGISVSPPLLTNTGTIQVAGQITGTAASMTNISSGVVGSIELNGACEAQTLAGTVFVNSDVKNFKVSNVSTTPLAALDAPVISNAKLDVWGELGFGSAGTFKTNGQLTLVSTFGTTANVAKLTTSHFIDGAVTVERYIKTGTGTGEHDKTWQALATPTGANSIGQTIFDSWQEGGNVPIGYGTHIADTRINWSPLGFDAQSVNSDNGINIYNTSSQSFDPIPGPPGTAAPLYNKTGYMIFVRGDRSIDQYTTPANQTNLRSKGALFQPHTGYTPPDVAVPLTLPGTPPDYQFAMIGNPYASAIDINFMKNTSGYFNNLTNNVYVWDPLLYGAYGYGGYQTLVASLGYQAEPGNTALYDYHNTAYTEIQSGQAFFMTINANSTVGSVHFDENVKSSNSRVVTRNADVKDITTFKANLYFNQQVTDGNVVIFDKAYSKDIDANDAAKLRNPRENFMIGTARANVFLAAEARQPVLQTDSVFYELKNLAPTSYQLQFVPQHFQPGLNATLIDNYLHSKIPLSLEENSIIDFKADADKASYENRFVVVFERNAKLSEDEIANVKSALVIYPNPVSDGKINFRLIDQASGRYSVQLISHAGQVVYNGSIEIKDDNTTGSIKTGNIAAGNYDLVLTAADGKKSVQHVLIK